MDDKPVIEYHPFGTLTLNFDEQPIKLRRCRLGDLEFAKNLLEEKRAEHIEERQGWVEEIASLRQALADLPEELTDEDRVTFRAKVDRINEAARFLEDARVEIIYGWLAPVIERMGDGTPPARDDWPLEIFDPDTPNSIVGHWQTRPLASGRPNPNGAAADSKPSMLSPPTVSSPQEQPQP
jgi:hypothetical protein